MRRLTFDCLISINSVGEVTVLDAKNLVADNLIFLSQ